MSKSNDNGRESWGAHASHHALYGGIEWNEFGTRHEPLDDKYEDKPRYHINEEEEDILSPIGEHCHKLDFSTI